MSETNTGLTGENKQAKREILIFFTKLLIVYVSWRLFSLLVGEQIIPIEERIWPELSAIWEAFNQIIRDVLLFVSKWFLKLLGYNAEVYGNHILYIPDEASVSVGNYCLSIQMMVLYLALIVSVRLPLKVKIISTVAGLLILNMLNVFRVAGVCIITKHYPEFAQFSHDYIFNIIMLVAIIAMYAWIINRYKK